MSTGKRRSRDEDSSGDESSDEEEQAAPAAAPAGGGGVDSARLEQLKREKRLAMNRESARARRRRKKIRLETLEQQAEDLSQRHHNLMLSNQQLKTRVAQLEAELATVGGSNRAAVGVGGMDPSSVLGGGLGAGAGLGRGGGQDVASLAATANLGLSVEQRALQQQAFARRGAGSNPLGGLGMAGMDPEMQYLQMQQQLLSANRGGDEASGTGTGSSTAARLMALEDLQRRNQLAALRGGLPDADLLNQQAPGFRRIDEMNRLRGTEGLRGVMDLGLSADAAARLRDPQATNPSQGSGAGSRDLKSELYERLANTNKKFPPPS